MGKWTSQAGPIQTRKVEKAIKALEWKGMAHIQINDRGRSEVVSFMIGGGKGANVATPELERIGEKYAWTITRENYKAIVEDLDTATRTLVLPEVDQRRTPEQRAESERIMSAQAERDRLHKIEVQASAAVLRAKQPSWAAALIVAELHEDDSDPMSDYHNHQTVRRVAIGWRRGTREDFAQLRRAAATFPETAHLGPNSTPCTIRSEWADEAFPHHSPGHRCPGLPLDGKEYATIEEAQAAIGDDKDGIALAYSDGKTGKALYIIHPIEIEHRENYSMGAGNYLKHGHSDSSGWCVKSRSLGDLDAYVFEDHLHEPGAPETTPAPGNAKFDIQKHHHTKNGVDFWLLVPTERMDGDLFEAVRSNCKAAGGWYSRKWGRCPGGFAFESEEAAKAFAGA